MVIVESLPKSLTLLLSVGRSCCRRHRRSEAAVGFRAALQNPHLEDTHVYYPGHKKALDPQWVSKSFIHFVQKLWERE